MPSIPVRATARLIATVGLNGWGYVVYNPSYVSIAGSSTSAAANPINFSTSTFPGDSGTPIPQYANPLPAGMGSTLCSGHIQGVAAYTSGECQARHVLSAIRVQYIGTELNRGGEIYLWNDLEDLNVVGMTPTNILIRPDVSVKPVDREWHTLRLVSAAPWAKNMNSAFTLASSAALAAGTGAGDPTLMRPMYIGFTGTPGNQFRVEVVTYYEDRFNAVQQLYREPEPSKLGAELVGAVAQAVSGASNQVANIAAGALDVIQENGVNAGGLVNSLARLVGMDSLLHGGGRFSGRMGQQNRHAYM